MHARVVRFTGVTEETVEKVVRQVDESDGPPPGVNATAMKLIYDSDQGTGVFIAFFDSAEDAKAADEVMGAMDPGDTPGSRASVDIGEVVIERSVG
jgi:hypothetical protein